MLKRGMRWSQLCCLSGIKTCLKTSLGRMKTRWVLIDLSNVFWSVVLVVLRLVLKLVLIAWRLVLRSDLVEWGLVLRSGLVECGTWLTRIRFVSLVSSAGKGVYTAKATQLPRMVRRIRNSKGFHSTIWKVNRPIRDLVELVELGCFNTGCFNTGS